MGAVEVEYAACRGGGDETPTDYFNGLIGEENFAKSRA